MLKAILPIKPEQIRKLPSVTAVSIENSKLMQAFSRNLYFEQ